MPCGHVVQRGADGRPIRIHLVAGGQRAHVHVPIAAEGDAVLRGERVVGGEIEQADKLPRREGTLTPAPLAFRERGLLGDVHVHIACAVSRVQFGQVFERSRDLRDDVVGGRRVFGRRGAGSAGFTKS